MGRIIPYIMEKTNVPNHQAVYHSNNPHGFKYCPEKVQTTPENHATNASSNIPEEWRPPKKCDEEPMFGIQIF